MQTFELNNISEIKKAAVEILKLCRNNNRILAFYGDLGAGKTTIIKKICELLNAQEPASSPTFSLINEYSIKNNGKIYHFDFYRINDIEEIYDFGYEEYFFSNNYCFIEWPEKIESLLPKNSIKINIDIVSKEKRKISIITN